MIEHSQIYTTRASKSIGEVVLSWLEIELTRAMRTVPIGSNEGRRLFAHRARLRQQLARGGEDLIFIARRDQPAGGAA